MATFVTDDKTRKQTCVGLCRWGGKSSSDYRRSLLPSHITSAPPTHGSMEVCSESPMMLSPTNGTGHKITQQPPTGAAAHREVASIGFVKGSLPKSDSLDMYFIMLHSVDGGQEG